LGDIDVLAADPSSSTLWAIEAKNLAIARTPPEWANEIEKILKSASGNSSAAEKHQSRCDWLMAHADETLKWLGLGDIASPWRVRSLIVTQADLFSPQVAQGTVPVISFRRMQELADRRPFRID
jgi:hypothetical protein